MRELLLSLFRPLVRSWAAAVEHDLESVARPIDAPRAVAEGVDSDRLLVIGSGPAVGWGVVTHDLSLAGALARAVSLRTGRGVVVDVVPDALMTASSGIHSLEEDKLWRYDAVIVLVGINDAVALTPVAEFKRDMRSLLGHIERASSLSTNVFAVAIPTITELPVYRGVIGRIAQWHASALNRAAAQVAATLPRTTFVPFSHRAAESAASYRGPEEYRAMAELLVDVVVAPLSAHRVPLAEVESRVEPTASARAEIEQQRQRAVDALGIAGSAPEERFDRIVDSARRAFDVRAALFSVIDGDRQWNKSRANFDLEEIPRSESACSITIETPGALIIPDTRKDARVSSYPFVVGDPQFRFYAGFPVESPTGERIGSLSLLDDAPRNDLNTGLLREFALLVQQELWHGQAEPVGSAS